MFHEIPPEILAALLDHEGSHGVLSPRPLMGRAGGVNRHQLAELYAGNFVQLPHDDKVVSTPEFAQAAQVLLNPATQMTFRIWRDEEACAETSVLFPGDLIDAGGVTLNQIDGDYRIVSPVSLDDVIRLISSVIPPMDNKAAGFDFEGNFDIPVAAVLFGLIDMVRLHAEGGKGRQDPEVACFSPAQISAFLEGWWGLTEFRHLTSYIAAAGMMPRPPALNEVEYSLGLLADAQVVRRTESNGIILARTMVPLLDFMPETVPGLQWQRISLTDAHEILASNRIFVFGNNSLILSFSPIPQGKIYVSTTNATALTEFLLQELTTVMPRRTRETPAENVQAASSRCSVCGKEQDQNTKFCTHCGAAHCPHCHNYVKKGTFCRTCGKRLK